MAFPGTYNFSYYKGDTFELEVFPKTSSGAPFDLTTFVAALFTISTARGVAGLLNQIDCYAQISGNKIVCAIRPEDGLQMNAETQYVYDIQIFDPASPYDKVYTLLTGNISVTDQVTAGETS
jgi:hypothetical protein